jgi:hypothetical protein
MNYLTKLFLLNPIKTAPKREILITSSAIDYLTWYKKDLAALEGTLLHTISRDPINHAVDGDPENVNQIAFDGLFFKCTVHWLSNGGMKKYTAWLNPDNIACLYSEQPDDCNVFFRSGARVLVVNKSTELMRNLLEHFKKYKERKSLKYGKKPL